MGMRIIGVNLIILATWKAVECKGQSAQDFYPVNSFGGIDNVVEDAFAPEDVLFQENQHDYELYADVYNEWKDYFKVDFDTTDTSTTSTDRDDGDKRPSMASVNTARLKVFADRYDELESWLNEHRRSNLPFTVDLNSLAALSDAELQALRGFTPSEQLEELRLEARSTSDGRSRGLTSAGRPLLLRRQTLATEEIPKEMDWRKLGVVTDVKSQGRCGACWAFTATAALEGSLALDSGVLVSLSERELIDCDSAGKNAGCAGGNYYYAFEFTEYGDGHSLSTSKDYPYTDKTGAKAAICRAGEVVGVAHSSPLIYFVERSEQAMMEAVMEQPVAVAISGYRNEFVFYSGGILRTPDCGTEVDHAVLLVGFGETEEGEKYWLIKNSWGVGWGEAGYARLARGDEELLKQTNGLGQCGILYQANYLSSGICAVEDCTGYASREFCTVELGCINSTSPFDGTIPTRKRFIRDLGLEAGDGIVDNPVLLASVITGAVAGFTLLVVGALYVREWTSNPKGLKELEEFDPAEEEVVAAQPVRYGFIDEPDFDGDDYYAESSGDDNDDDAEFDDVEAFIGFDEDAISRGARDRRKSFSRRLSHKRRKREDEFCILVGEFRKRCKDQSIEEATIARYLNGVDGDVKAASKLYLKKEGATRRWL